MLRIIISESSGQGAIVELYADASLLYRRHYRSNAQARACVAGMRAMRGLRPGLLFEPLRVVRLTGEGVDHA